MRQAFNSIIRGIAAITAFVMTTNGALAETTIDSGAKPYFIVGGVIATILFMSIGAMLIRKGNRYIRIAAAVARSHWRGGVVRSGQADR
jgi:hypothetical protein